MMQGGGKSWPAFIKEKKKDEFSKKGTGCVTDLPTGMTRRGIG